MYEISKFPCTTIEITPRNYNIFISIMAGLLFFSGWWLVIDANSMNRPIFDADRVYHLPGVFGSLAMIFMNAVPARALYDSYYYNTSGGCCGKFAVKLFLFFVLSGSFGCLIAACYILVNDFILNQEKFQWPGYAIFFQNLFILSASLMMRFAKKGYF